MLKAGAFWKGEGTDVVIAAVSQTHVRFRYLFSYGWETLSVDVFQRAFTFLHDGREELDIDREEASRWLEEGELRSPFLEDTLLDETIAQLRKSGTTRLLLEALVAVQDAVRGALDLHQSGRFHFLERRNLVSLVDSASLCGARALVRLTPELVDQAQKYAEAAKDLVLRAKIYQRPCPVLPEAEDTAVVVDNSFWSEPSPWGRR